MKNKILLLLLTLVSLTGQSQNKNILYVVDSIPIIEEPKEGFNILTEEDIDNIVVLKNKKSIDSLGYKNIDKIIYIFTKLYIKRPDSIKKIPTSKVMKEKNGSWYLKNSSTTYSGKFIDYYFTGIKQGEGTLFNGKLKGKRLLYYQNGEISDEIEYENGVSNGIEKRYYKNGVLMQKGILKNGKEIGQWEMYHPNKELKQVTYFENGKMIGEVISYYSTGEIKGKSFYINGVYQKNKITDKVFKYYNQSQKLYKLVNYKKAIKKLNKALELKPGWAKGYFARGTMKLNNFQFDEAIKDFDKTLKIEPYFTNAYANRAFTIIRKHEFGKGRTISKSKDIQIIASKKTEIPKSEINRICSDLKKAISLGDNNRMVSDAIKKYCAK